MDTKIYKLLLSEARRINLEFEEASISGSKTPSDVSDRREPHVANFIKKYFPFPYRVAKGRIVDTHGNESNSIDCVLLNPMHPYTINPGSEEYAMLLADGVDAVVEVKPNLVGCEVERSLKQISSIKQLRRINSAYFFENTVNSEHLNYSKQITTFIFSTSTYVDIYLLIERIVNYYADNKIPKCDQFDYIVINQRCIVYNARFNSVVNKSNQTAFKKEGIKIVPHGEKCLVHFLYRLNTIFPSVPNMVDPIINGYLKFDWFDEIKDTQWFENLDKQLLSI